MSHETENPLIIDVVGQVESSDASESCSSKKAGKGAAKKGFFRRAAATATAQAATPEDVSAAKRAACEASVPRVDVPPVAPAGAPENVPSGQAPSSSDRPSAATVSEAPSMQPPASGSVPASAPAQQAPQGPAAQPAPISPQPAPQPPTEQPSVVEAPVAPSAVTIPPQQPVAPIPQAYPAAAATVAAPRRSPAIYVFGILVAIVVVFAVAAAAFYAFLQTQERIELPTTGQTTDTSNTSNPMVSSTFDQASKVSLRATAEGWSEEGSTPLIVYIKRVDDTTAQASSDEPSSTSSDAEERGTDASQRDASERYFAFAPDKNASVSLSSGRYTFSFITPLNSDGSLYEVPEMVDMVVGDGGTAVLPIELTRIAADQVSDEQISQALAQLKTAWEKKDPSFASPPFATSIAAALDSWFSDKDTATEEPATELTAEQHAALDAQADSQDGHDDEGSSSGGEAPASGHVHDWVAQYEQRWEPNVVPIIDTPAWESPVYASYRCQEGILFETLDECLAHVREHGNESYTSSNEIIRIDYHPAIVHYEDRGRLVNMLTGYRCSICGATGTL